MADFLNHHYCSTTHYLLHKKLEGKSIVPENYIKKSDYLNCEIF